MKSLLYQLVLFIGPEQFEIINFKHKNTKKITRPSSRWHEIVSGF